MVDDCWPVSFEEFVLEYQPRASWFYRLSQSELLAPVRLDAVVRFDRLEQALYRMPPIAAALEAGHVLEPLPRLNETSHRPWQELCTPRLSNIIAYRWSADLDFCQARFSPSRHSAR